MLKTITKVKEMKLDELIKYVRENKKTLFKNRVGITFNTKNNNQVTFYQHGELTLDNWISSVDLFTVEIEEEITEDTKFEFLVEVYKNGKESFATGYYNYELKDVIDYDTELIYALVNGELELIYKRKEESINA